MFFTIKQTIDPAILDTKLDDGMGTNKAFASLNDQGYKTARDLSIAGGQNLRRAPDVGHGCTSKIDTWLTSHNIPFFHSSTSPTVLDMLSCTASYEVSFEGVGKATEKVLAKLSQNPGRHHQVVTSVPIIKDDGAVIGKIKVTIYVEIE